MRNRHQAPENKHCRNISKQQLFESRSSPWGAYFCMPCSSRLSLSDISRRQHQAGDNFYCRAKPCGAWTGAPPLKLHVQNIMFCAHCFTTSANFCFPAFFSPPEIDHSAGALAGRRHCGRLLVEIFLRILRCKLICSAGKDATPSRGDAHTCFGMRRNWRRALKQCAV